MARTLTLIDPGPPHPNKRNQVNLPLLSVGNHVRGHCSGWDVEIIDLRFESSINVVNAVSQASAVGIACPISHVYVPAVTLASDIRRAHPHLPIIAGGHHANILPEEFEQAGLPEQFVKDIVAPPLFDYVVSGPGEIAVAQILQSLEARNLKRPGKTALLAGVPLPPGAPAGIFDWTLQRKYFQRKGVFPQIMLKFSGGCPQRCNFCSNSGTYQHHFYLLSPADAMRQLRLALEFIIEEGAERDPRTYLEWGASVGVADEVFGQNPAWQRSFLTKLVEQRRTLPFEDFTLHTQIRLDSFRASDAELFDKARVNVGFGVESLDPSILARMRKAANPSRFLAQYSCLIDHAQYVLKHTYYALMIVVGFPSETRESLARTVRGLRVSSQTCPNPFFVNPSPFMLFPGTEVHRFMDRYRTLYGSEFHFPRWWRDGLGNGVTEQLVNDPSASVPYAAFSAWFQAEIPPLLEDVFDRSMALGAPPVFTQFRENWRKTLEKMAYIFETGRMLLNQKQRARHRKFRGDSGKKKSDSRPALEVPPVVVEDNSDQSYLD